MKARLLAGGVVVAVLASTAVAASGDDVTLRVDKYYDAACRCYRVNFSGSISSGAANEYVTILQQRCGSRFSTAVAGATTREGGFWEATTAGRAFAPPLGSGTIRARWKGQLSEPVTFCPPLRIWVSKRPGGRFSVSVGADARLDDDHVALQRLVGGRWTHVRRLRLEVDGQRGFGGGYWTTFGMSRRALTMRIFVPAKTAAPCYDAVASATFVS